MNREEANDDPANDAVGTVRVHPGHDPNHPRAQRVIRTDGGNQLQWTMITGRDTGEADGSDWHTRSSWEISVKPWTREQPWPRQSLIDLHRVLDSDYEPVRHFLDFDDQADRYVARVVAAELRRIAGSGESLLERADQLDP